MNLNSSVWMISFSLFLTIVTYGVSYFLSTRELFWNYKNIGLCFFFVYLYLKIFAKQRKIFTSIVVLMGVSLLVGMVIPFINYLDQPLYITRLMKDVLFYFTLPLPLLLVPVVLNNRLGSKYSILCTIIIGVAFLPTLMVIGYYLLFDTKPSVDAIMAIMKTDFQESREFIQSYISFEDFLIVAGYFGILWTVYKAFKDIFYNFDIEVSKRTRLVSLGILIALIVNSTMLFAKTYMVITVQRGLQLNDKLVQFDDNKRVREELLASTCNVRREGGNQNFALIIGETHNRSHMSAFGYERKTTPWLDKAVSNKKVILPSKTYSCAAQTEHALALALTEKSQYNNLKMHQAMTIVEMAKHAGFKVVWVTNHMNDSVAGLIAGEADETYWLNNSKNDTFERQRTDYIDTLVVNKIKELKYSGEKTLYVMHLIGSHAAYRFKYPDDFRIWDDEDKINAYDNSVLFNDYVISELYTHLFGELNVDGLVYFADHGEELKEYFCHGTDFFLKHFRKSAAAKEIINIPVYFAFSKLYKERYPEVINGLTNNKEKFFTNDMVYDTMLGIMGITCCHYDARQDFTDNSYKFELEDLRTLSGRLKLSECI